MEGKASRRPIEGAKKAMKGLAVLRVSARGNRRLKKKCVQAERPEIRIVGRRRSPRGPLPAVEPVPAGCRESRLAYGDKLVPRGTAEGREAVRVWWGASRVMLRKPEGFGGGAGEQ